MAAKTNLEHVTQLDSAITEIKISRELSGPEGKIARDRLYTLLG